MAARSMSLRPPLSYRNEWLEKSEQVRTSWRTWCGMKKHVALSNLRLPL